MQTYDSSIAILSYAVISDRFNNGESVILSFAPLVEELLLSIADDTVSKSNLIDLYQQKYGYAMPPAILQEILVYLRNRGKIDLLKNDYLDINRKELQEVSYEYATMLNSLKNNFSFFAKDNGINIKPTEVVQVFLEFMSKYAIDLNAYFNNLHEENDINYDDSDAINRIIIDFLMRIKLDNPNLFELLNDIYYGMVLSSVLQLDQTEINDLENNSDISELLLDSNYIFRLLDLQTAYEHKATIHTHQLAQDAKISFYVLPETLEQIASTLNGFMIDINPGATKILSSYGDDAFSGIHSAYIRRNLDLADINEIISNLQTELLEKFGVKIWEKEIAIITDDDNDAISSMSKFKLGKEIESLQHDLKLVRTIDIARPQYIPDMSKAKSWVLTDDNKLMKWSSSKYNNKRIPECLTESQLSTILWLKSPKQFNGQALENVICALRNQSLVGKEQFRRISNAIEKQKERVANDKAKINVMPLLFSPQCLSLDEIDKTADSDENINRLFDEGFNRAKKYSDEVRKDKEKYKNEYESVKQKLEIAYEKERESLSIISQKDKAIIEVLQRSHKNIGKMLSEKKQQKDDCVKGREKLIEKTIKNLNILIFVIAVIIIFSILIINARTDIFKEVGNAISLITTFLGFVICIVFGTNLSNCIFKFKEKAANKIIIKEVTKGKCEDFDKKIHQIDEQITDYKEQLEKIDIEFQNILET